RNAILFDRPRSASGPISWWFLTAAICKKGKDANKIYGSLFWGLEIDKFGTITSKNVEFVGDPTADGTYWNDSIANWNSQASGNKPPKNHGREKGSGVFYRGAAKRLGPWSQWLSRCSGKPPHGRKRLPTPFLFLFRPLFSSFLFGPKNN